VTATRWALGGPLPLPRKAQDGVRQDPQRGSREAGGSAGDEGPPPAFEPTTITVRKLFEQYDAVARDTMKRESYATYQSIGRKHLLPAFGSCKLADLSRKHGDW
jgi:hypothetical protein